MRSLCLHAIVHVSLHCASELAETHRFLPNAAFSLTFTVPALYGEGTALTIAVLEPCGTNLPHVHPRGTEIVYVATGKNVSTIRLANGSCTALMESLAACAHVSLLCHLLRTALWHVCYSCVIKLVDVAFC